MSQPCSCLSCPRACACRSPFEKTLFLPVRNVTPRGGPNLRETARHTKAGKRISVSNNCASRCSEVIIEDETLARYDSLRDCPTKPRYAGSNRPVPPPGSLAIEPSVDDEGSLTITFHNTTFDRWRINDASIRVPWRPRCPAKLPPIEIAPYIDLGQNGCSLGA
jgi:hypothetical protein